MSPWRVVLYLVLGLLLAGAVVGTAHLLADRTQAEADQSSLAPFYVPPPSIPAEPGTVIRTEPLTGANGERITVPGGRAYRMLYVTALPDGTPTVSGGSYFVPDAPAAPGGRPIVAWAHGTVGMGDACAPSRSRNPVSQFTTWLPQAMEQGWAVVATDYAGLGTPGVQLYLVGESEARDVVNSVRAVRTIPGVDAGDRYVVMGHSQGGHSALWTGERSHDLAPELDLAGVVSIAPAAELREIVGAQWSTAVGWAIGPEAAVAWRAIAPALPLEGVLTDAGLRQYERLATECIELAGLEGMARADLGQSFFAVDPDSQPDWSAMIGEQTPRPLPPDIPVLLAQGTADQVVLPWPNALLQERWCAAGSTISSLWMGNIDHMKAPFVAGPQAVTWIGQRFAGDPAPRTCDVPPPVAPVPSSTPSASAAGS